MIFTESQNVLSWRDPRGSPSPALALPSHPSSPTLGSPGRALPEPRQPRAVPAPSGAQGENFPDLQPEPPLAQLQPFPGAVPESRDQCLPSLAFQAFQEALGGAVFLPNRAGFWSLLCLVLASCPSSASLCTQMLIPWALLLVHLPAALFPLPEQVSWSKDTGAPGPQPCESRAFWQIALHVGNNSLTAQQWWLCVLQTYSNISAALFNDYTLSFRPQWRRLTFC